MSGIAIIDYMNRCPKDRVRKLFLKALELKEVNTNFDMVNVLAKDMYFPIVKHIDVSPSGHAPFGKF